MRRRMIVKPRIEAEALNVSSSFGLDGTIGTSSYPCPTVT